MTAEPRRDPGQRAASAPLGGSLRLLVACIAGLFALSCATPIEEQRWLRAKTANFEIVSSAPATTTRRVAEQLERFRALVIEVTRLEEFEPATPSVVFLFGDTETFSAYRPRRLAQGYMLPGSERNYLVVNGDALGEAVPIAFHEFVHLVLHDQAGVSYPAWFNEGLAEMLSTVRFEEGKAVIGDIPASRAGSLLYGSSLGIRRIFTARDVMQWSSRATSMFYAEAWALTHFLHTNHLLGGERHVDKMTAYLDAVLRGAEPEPAFERAFGTSFEDFESEFLAHVSAGKFPRLALESAAVAADVSVEIEPMEARQHLILLGDLATSLGPDWTDLAENHYRSAHEIDPTWALAAASRARVLAHGGETEPAHRILAELQIDTLDDAATLQRAADAFSGLKVAGRAKDLYRASLRLEPERVASLVGLAAMLAMDSGENLEAIELLEKARRSQPNSTAISTALARRYVAASSPEGAKPLVDYLGNTPHTFEAGYPEAQDLAELARLSGIEDTPISRRHLVARLEVDSSARDEVMRTTAPISEIAGRAGLSEALSYDVVIAIDESNSTLAPSGRDIDGDGEIGAPRPHRESTRITDSTDKGDSVLMAELAAARQLLERVDPASTRVALVFFSGQARVLAPLGSPDAARAVLDDYRYQLDFTGTSHGNALAVSLTELRERRDPSRRRARIVALLSDGVATMPSVPVARRHATEVAEILGQYGIRVDAYALGPDALQGNESYQELAQRAGGRFIPVRTPGDIEHEFAELSLSGLERVSIKNLHTGESARAVSVLADGSFSGFASLRPGDNLIEIVAHLDDHPPIRAERRIFYDPPVERTPQQEREVTELLERMKARTVALGLAAEIRAARKAAAEGTVRNLEIEVEAPAPAPAPAPTPGD